MKLPRSVVFSLLTASILISMALRYPTTGHETGVDSFFIHNLTTSIVRDGNAKWILNPLSFFGLFPLSYPSAGPFFLASFSELSDLSIELVILLASLAFGAFGALSSFALAREFRDDDFFCLAVSFIYSFAPRFLSFTLWTASMRGLFMAFLPVFVWTILKAYREPSVKNFSVLILVFGILAAIHRLGILMTVIVVGSIFAYLIVLVLRILRIRVPRFFLRSFYQRSSSYLALGATAGVVLVMLLGTDILGAYSEGQLATGRSVEVELFNLGISLARSTGLALLFAVLGLFVLARSRNKTIREPFLVVAFIALIPTLFLRAYTGFYILPFVAILGGLALLSTSRIKRRKSRQFLLALSLAAMMVFSAVVLHYEEGSITVMANNTYSTATYISAMHTPVTISNDGLLGVRVAALSGCPYLPVGGAGTTFQSPELLSYRFFNTKEIYQNLTRIPLADLTLESDSLWVVGSIQAELDWVKIMQSPYDHPKSTLTRYRPVLYLENRNVGVSFYAYGNTYPSAFAQSAHDDAYLIYESPSESLYYVYSP